MSDVLQLIVQDLLESEKGVFMAGGDEVELVDQLGASHAPRLLASDRAGRGVSDIEGDDPQRHPRSQRRDVHPRGLVIQLRLLLVVGHGQDSGAPASSRVEPGRQRIAL